MELQWYYARGGMQHGPVTEGDLKTRAERGELLPTDLVWKQGMSEWVAARTLPALWPEHVAPPAMKSEPPGIPPMAASLDWDRVRALTALHVRRLFTWDLQGVVTLPEERDRLQEAGVTDELAGRYLVWRRSMLWVVLGPGVLAVLFGLIGAIRAFSGGSPGVVFLNCVLFTGVCAIPASAYLAAQCYDRVRQSQRVVLWGGGIAYALALWVALAPAEWWVGGATDAEPVSLIGRMFFGLVAYLLLMPSVLALLPALCRACVRLKTLLPASLPTAWVLIGGAPLAALLTLVAFIPLYHAFGNILLLAGVLLVIGAPLIYLSRPRLLIRPSLHGEQLRAMSQLQGIMIVATGAGVALVLLFLFTGTLASLVGEGRLARQEILGFGSSALLRPWSSSLHAFWTEYLTRSLFLTVLFADLLTRMNLSIWRQQFVFQGTAEAVHYDHAMSSLNGVLGRPPALPSEPPASGPETPAPTPDAVTIEEVTKTV